jgi:hypothetical protein
MAIVAGGAAAATAGARYAASKRINASEKLGEALLDTERLADAKRCGPAETESALAACAVYVINTAHRAAAGITGPPTLDPVGFERTVKSDHGGGSAIVTTTAHEPETRWQFEVTIPDVGRVSGSRRLTSSKFAGTKVRMSTPDTVAIHFDGGYSVRVESDLEFTSALLKMVGPVTQIYGTAHLSDNRDNVGHVKIEQSGEVTGTVTRRSDIVGRFEGSLSEGVTFKQYSPA